jgi:hypothetical protein
MRKLTLPSGLTDMSLMVHRRPTPSDRKAEQLLETFNGQVAKIAVDEGPDQILPSLRVGSMHFRGIDEISYFVNVITTTSEPAKPI